MTIKDNKTVIKGNTILFDRKFIPLQQDITYNNLNILNDGKIFLLVDDDESSITANPSEHGFLLNLPGLDIEKPLKKNNNNDHYYTLSDFYQRKQFSLSCPKEDVLSVNKFLKISDQLNKAQPLINSQYQTSIRRVFKNQKYPIILVLTNNFNILSFDYKNDNLIDQTNHQHFKFLQNIDHKLVNGDVSDLRYNVFYDAAFDNSGDFIAISNRKGDILLFKFNTEISQFDFVTSTNIIENGNENGEEDFITSLRNVNITEQADDNNNNNNKFQLLGKSNKNKLYKITFNLNNNSHSSELLSSIKNNKFMISDFVSVEGKFFYISANKLYDETDKEIASFSNYDLKQIKYIHSLQQLIIYSNNELYTLDLNTMKLVETPFVNFLIKKYNISKLDNPNLSLNIHGIDVTSNESILSVLYSFTVNGGMSYVTSFTRDISLSIIKLQENWELSGSNYNESVKLWYFQYKFFGDKQPSNYEFLLNEQNNLNNELINYDQPFSSFIVENIIENKHMKFNKYETLIQDTSVLKSSLYIKILTHFYNYAKFNKEKLTSPIDLFSLSMISRKLNLEQIVDTSDKEYDFTKVLFKGPFIEETFNIKECLKEDKLVSNNGYPWKVCFLTLLPLLTTNTKHCAITNIDIIDIDKDLIYNDYGWFTKTILELLGKKSFVSDIEYV